ncbi:hypothetical protein [Deinococcus sp. SL84]|uniref:hypothetical protein n=1 Tax=Deinococcus sp. SL84 TaxID=2994663 RepID=UPI002274AFAB|nr:hypothetical protein [Deinococcus sp. SL84]MCY1704403.1 hypothetical protein [Deinococcus sp. SL84]
MTLTEPSPAPGHPHHLSHLSQPAADDPIHQVPQSRAYGQVLAIAEASPNPRYRDVTHWDRASLAHNPQQFVWLLGEHFTHLLLYRGSGVHEVLDYHQHDTRVRVFVCGGGQLQEADFPKAHLAASFLPHFYHVHAEHGLFQLRTDNEVVATLPLEEGAALLKRQEEVHTEMKAAEPWDSRAVHAFQGELQAIARRYRA